MQRKKILEKAGVGASLAYFVAPKPLRFSDLNPKHYQFTDTQTIRSSISLSPSAPLPSLVVDLDKAFSGCEHAQESTRPRSPLVQPAAPAKRTPSRSALQASRRPLAPVSVSPLLTGEPRAQHRVFLPESLGKRKGVWEFRLCVASPTLAGILRRRTPQLKGPTAIVT